MADRLWKKVLETSEQVQDLQAELWRVHEEVEKVGGSMAEQAGTSPEAVDKGALEAGLNTLRDWTQQRVDGQAAQLDEIHAAVQKLLQAEADTRQELESVRKSSGEKVEELFGHVASAEEHMQALGARLDAAEGALHESQAALTAGLDACRASLAGVDTSGRSRHEELRAEVERLRAALENQAIDVVAEIGTAVQQHANKAQELHDAQQLAYQHLEGLVQKAGAASAQQHQHLDEFEGKLGSFQKGLDALPTQLQAMEDKLGKLDKDVSALPSQKRYEALEHSIGELQASVKSGSAEQREAAAELQHLKVSAQDLAKRLEEQGHASQTSTAELREQHAGAISELTLQLQASAKEQGEQLRKEQGALQTLRGEVQELAQGQQALGKQLDERLRASSGSLEATLAAAEERLRRGTEDAAAEAAKELNFHREQTARGEAALQAELGKLLARAEQHEAQGAASLAATEGCLEAVEALRPQLGAVLQRAAACERRLQASEAWQGACTEWQSAQDERHATHTKGLQLMAERCQEVCRHVDAKVAEVRAAAKEDFHASALNSFQGEMKLWAKLAQMSGRPGLPQGLLQAAAAPGTGYALPAGGMAPMASARTASPPAIPRAGIDCAGW